MSAGVLDTACVFCRIIRGEIPAQRVFESERILAFLDIGPLAPGHTVVIAKHHVPSLEDLPAEWAAELARVFGPIARAVSQAVAAEGFNVLLNNGQVAGQVVPHVHFHVVPRRAGDGLGYRWRTKPASPEELAELAARIKAGLQEA